MEISGELPASTASFLSTHSISRLGRIATSRFHAVMPIHEPRFTSERLLFTLHTEYTGFPADTTAQILFIKCSPHFSAARLSAPFGNSPELFFPLPQNASISERRGYILQSEHGRVEDVATCTQRQPARPAPNFASRGAERRVVVPALFLLMLTATSCGPLSACITSCVPTVRRNVGVGSSVKNSAGFIFLTPPPRPKKTVGYLTENEQRLNNCRVGVRFL
jgi:hypothetical protein